MKILQVIPNLSTGGAEVFVVSLCNALVNMGHNVTLLTFYSRNNEEFLYSRLDSHVDTICLPKRKGVDLLLSFRLKNLIRRGRYEVVHLHVQAIIYAILPCLVYRKCQYIATIHNDAYKEAAGIHRWIRKFMFTNNLVTPVTISEESKVSFEALYKISSTMIYNGVSINYVQAGKATEDVSRYKLTPQTKIFVYVASVNGVKNQLNAAKAFNRLGSEGVDVVLLILGRLTETEYCKRVRKEASDHVII